MLGDDDNPRIARPVDDTVRDAEPPRLREKLLNRRSAVALATTLVVSAAALFGIFSMVDAKATLEALSQVPVWAVAGLFACVAVDIFGVGSLRSWLALRECGYNVPFREVLFARTAVTPVVMFLPLQSGELPYVVWLTRVKKVPLTGAAAAILSEKYATVLALLELGCAAGIALKLPVPPIVFWAGLVPVSFLMHPRFVGWLLGRFGRRAGRFGPLLERAAGDLGRLSFPGMLRLNATALLLHINVGVFSWLCFSLLNVDIPLISAVLLWPVTLVLSAAPVTLGGIGLREAVFVLVYGGYGTDSAVLGAALLFSATAMPVHFAPVVWFFPRLMAKIMKGPASDA